MYTLLVIDMQKGFLDQFDSRNNSAAKVSVIEGCKRAIRQAIKDGAEIFDVNYRGSYGPTIPALKRLWYKYKKMYPERFKKVVKSWDGGGKEVLAAEPQGDFMLTCGINAGACVYETVRQLRNAHVDIYVLAEAVANSWGHCEGDLDYYRNINILKSV